MTAPAVAIRDAIYSILVGDSALVATLGPSFEGGPKIFAHQPISDQVKEPFIIISGPIALPVGYTLGDDRRLRAQARRIRLHWPAYGDTAPLDEAAERVSRLLSLATLDLGEHQFRRCRAGEPFEIGTAPDSYGRSVEVVVAFQEAQRPLPAG